MHSAEKNNPVNCFSRGGGCERSERSLEVTKTKVSANVVKRTTCFCEGNPRQFRVTKCLQILRLSAQNDVECIVRHTERSKVSFIRLKPTRDILVFLFKINNTHNFMQQKRTAFQQSFLNNSIMLRRMLSILREML